MGTFTVMRIFLALCLFKDLSNVSYASADDTLDADVTIYKNDRGQCYYNSCHSDKCRDGGCCNVVVSCNGLKCNVTLLPDPPTDVSIHKNSRGQCYYNTCYNCDAGGCCTVVVSCDGREETDEKMRPAATYKANRHRFVESFPGFIIHGISIYNNFVAVAVNNSVILYFIGNRWEDGALLFKRKSTWQFGKRLVLNDSMSLLDFQLVDETSQFLCTATVCRVCNIAADNHITGCTHDDEYYLVMENSFSKIAAIKGVLVTGKYLILRIISDSNKAFIYVFRRGAATPNIIHDDSQYINAIGYRTVLGFKESHGHVYFVESMRQRDYGQWYNETRTRAFTFIRHINGDKNWQNIQSRVDIALSCNGIDMSHIADNQIEALAGVVDFDGQSIWIIIKNGTSNASVCQYLISQIETAMSDTQSRCRNQDAALLQAPRSQFQLCQDAGKNHTNIWKAEDGVFDWIKSYISLNGTSSIHHRQSKEAVVQSIGPGFSPGVVFLQFSDGTIKSVKMYADDSQSILQPGAWNKAVGYCDYYNALVFSGSRGSDLMYMTVSWEDKTCSRWGGSCRPSDDCREANYTREKFLCKWQPDSVQCCFPKQVNECQSAGGKCAFNHACGEIVSESSATCSSQENDGISCCKIPDVNQLVALSDSDTKYKIIGVAMLALLMVTLLGILLYKIRTRDIPKVMDLSSNPTLDITLTEEERIESGAFESSRNGAPVKAWRNGSKVFTRPYVKGEGNYATVYVHKVKNKLMAVKYVKKNLIDLKSKDTKTIVELEVIKKCKGCAHIVTYYGYNVNLNIMHRDIKPSNILLRRDGAIKVCDFGISDRLVTSKVRTHEVGSAAYLAPERVTNTPYGYRADVWSLGITLIELATGVRPYMQLEGIELETAIVDETPPRLSGNVTPQFISFVEKCTKKNPHDRDTFEMLLKNSFILQHKKVNVGRWYLEILKNQPFSKSNN